MASSEPRRWLRGRSFSDVAAVLGIAAAATYALGRLSLALFYGELGVSPEEVGWNLQNTVSGFGVVVLIVAAALTLLVTAGATAINGMLHALSRHPGHRWTTHWGSGIALGLTVSTIMLVVGLSSYPRELAQHVVEGRIPESTLLRLLPIQLSCVELRRPEVVDAGTPLVLLGRSNGVVVLFDPQRGAPLRVASGELHLEGSESCPASPNPWWLF